MFVFFFYYIYLLLMFFFFFFQNFSCKWKSNIYKKIATRKNQLKNFLAANNWKSLINTNFITLQKTKLINNITFVINHNHNHDIGPDIIIDKNKSCYSLRENKIFNKLIKQMVQAIFNGNKCKNVKDSIRYNKTYDMLYNYCSMIMINKLEKDIIKEKMFVLKNKNNQNNLLNSCDFDEFTVF